MATHTPPRDADPVSDALNAVEPLRETPSQERNVAAVFDRFDRLIAAVNLDELVSEVVTVAFTEWVKVNLSDEGPDGEPEVGYVPRVRTARIGTMTSTEAQLKAFALFNRFGNGGATGDESTSGLPFSSDQLAAMEECVLAVWQQSEPSMTLERLHRGLDLFKTMKLFALFFKRMLPSRLSSSLRSGGSGLSSNV